MHNSLFSYIEVKELRTGKVIKRFDVTDKKPSHKDKLEAGLNRNLNGWKYYTHSFDSEKELPEIK